MDSIGRTRYRAAKRSWVVLFMIVPPFRPRIPIWWPAAHISPRSRIAQVVIPPGRVTRLLPAGWRSILRSDPFIRPISRLIRTSE